MSFNQKEYNRKRHDDAKPAYEALMKYYPLTLEDLEGEQWKPIAGYGGYRISNFGRVKSFKQGKVIIRTPDFGHGYLRFTLCEGGKGRHFSAHQLVAQAFIPNPEGKPQVNHLDGHKLNCHVSNLEWATQAENQRHAVNTGLQKAGEELSFAKLTKEQLEEILTTYIPYHKEFGAVALAKKFGVDTQIIFNALAGRKYKKADNRNYSPRSYIPESVREEIKRTYIKGDRQFGSHALARKYGVNKKTITNIVNKKE